MKKMNKKAQFMSFLFGLFVFVILWIMFFARWVSDWAKAFIVANSSVGLEAFLVANMNVWILIGVIIGTVSALYFGGNN